MNRRFNLLTVRFSAEIGALGLNKIRTLTPHNKDLVLQFANNRCFLVIFVHLKQWNPFSDILCRKRGCAWEAENFTHILRQLFYDFVLCMFLTTQKKPISRSWLFSLYEKGSPSTEHKWVLFPKFSTTVNFLRRKSEK